jgi:hypothetical protein
MGPLFVAQRVLEEKSAEVEELQARLSHLAAQAPNIQIDTERSRVALLTQVRLHSYMNMWNCMFRRDGVRYRVTLRCCVYSRLYNVDW